MKYFIWKLLGRCFFINLLSHYESDGKKKLSEWEQKKDEIKNHRIYQLIS